MSQTHFAKRLGYRHASDLNNLERRSGRDAVRRSSLRRIRTAVADTGTPRRFRQDATSYSFFAQLGWNMTEELRTTFGLRYTRDDKDAERTLAITEINGDPLAGLVVEAHLHLGDHPSRGAQPALAGVGERGATQRAGLVRAEELEDRAAGPLLERDEARNQLPLGIAGNLTEHPDAYDVVRYWVGVAARRPVSAALRVEPHNLVRVGRLFRYTIAAFAASSKYSRERPMSNTP